MIMFATFIQKKYAWPLLVFLATLPAFFFLLKPGYYNMHDDMQMIRQLEMEKCLHDGQIPCRWSPDLGYGYGYPLFNFYPPLPYFVGQIYRTLGFSFVNTVKMVALTQIVLSALFIYILAANLFGKLGGFVSALFYTYAPYHALNIYVRGAMNEAWAAVFFPLIFYFAKKLIEQNQTKHLIALSLSFTGLLLSHNPMALTFSPFLLAWCLYFLFQKKFSLKIILSLVLSAILSLALSAFYTLPVLFETKYVQIETMFQNYYHYSAHFTSLYQLFISRFWDEGASIWGPNDGMSFQLGYLHWFLPLLIIIFYFIFRTKNKKTSQKLLLPSLLALGGFFAAFMTHQRSVIFWKALPLIQKIQFPWRFLNHSVFLFSLSLGVLPLLLSFLKIKKLYQKAGLILILILVFALNINYFHPLISGPITDQQKFEGKAWTNQITSGIYDYLPKTASTAAKGPAQDYIDDISPADTQYSLNGAKKGTDWLFFNLDLQSSAKLTLPLLAFPSFEVKDNFKVINFEIEPELGRLVLDLASGQHQIYVKLKNTPIRTLANSLSLLAWLSISAFGLKSLCKNPKSKK